MDWETFWAQPPEYFSNPFMRRERVEYLRDCLIGEGGVLPGSSLLDYGCGDSDLAPLLVEAGVKVFLYDRSPAYRAKAEQCAARTPNVQVVDEDFLRDRDGVTIDTILVCAVIQYLDDNELYRLLTLLRQRLARGGRLLVVDVPDHSSGFRDAIERLSDAWRYGYFLRALANIMRRLVRGFGGDLKFHRYSTEEMLDLLTRHGLDAMRAAGNFTPMRSRHTYIATGCDNAGR
ncbi:hypothetical protein CU669_10955 [Paramagnetospirillum kuznetsovii]|uniref:Class I SAM-dependent methyltransferase n=1 Tax=Paramagnetospirillum kuznetsovii TaxID=2053833 RepID=A0A364NXK6_9PROT|nr:class I SAM-dependent methyltransferase [Paramagnetospirillum kuznetsovii]RAU21818.1 hypothetical protein CU669_10955 [Paramagnetospirillum kuznetsovii]